MFDSVYQILLKLGYHHPLHPAITHLPVGLVIAALIFGFVGTIVRSETLSCTARHCTILALISVPPTALLGFMDWQHYYAGRWLFPIVMKLGLAAFLLVLLCLSVYTGMKSDPSKRRVLALYALSLIAVVGLGYFGGELVFGTKAPVVKLENRLAQKGSELFAQSCSMCHYPDKVETKVGPGLKGLFQREKLMVSSRPVSGENVRRQLKTPYANMPAFEDLTEEEIKAIIAYLQTL